MLEKSCLLASGVANAGAKAARAQRVIEAFMVMQRLSMKEDFDAEGQGRG